MIQNVDLQLVILYNNMYIKEDTIYADVYKYLKHKTKRIIALQIKGNPEDWDELDMTDPIQVKFDNKMIKWENGLLACIPETMTYEGIKTKIIKSRYSNDDQIAIILNKDKSDSDMLDYQRMQDWRDFAQKIAMLSQTRSKLDF